MPPSPALVRLRRIRARFGLIGLVQIHHIVPREHATHPAVTAFDIDGASNLMLMPTRRGMQTLGLRPGRLVHDGGHSHYNAYVYDRLNELVGKGNDVHGFAAELRARLRRSNSDLPWR